jgi:diaminopimelate decarboxylase
MSRVVTATARSTVLRLVALALVALGVAGCGQKGPLYLPDKNGSVVTRPATPNAQPNTPAQTPKKKDDDGSSTSK